MMLLWKVVQCSIIDSRRCSTDCNILSDCRLVWVCVCMCLSVAWTGRCNAIMWSWWYICDINPSWPVSLSYQVLYVCVSFDVIVSVCSVNWGAWLLLVVTLEPLWEDKLVSVRQIAAPSAPSMYIVSAWLTYSSWIFIIITSSNNNRMTLTAVMLSSHLSSIVNAEMSSIIRVLCHCVCISR